MKDIALEVRRTMNGWIVEFPGGEEVFADGGTVCYQMSTIHTDIGYEFMQEGDELVVRLRPPVTAHRSSKVTE